MDDKKSSGEHCVRSRDEEVNPESTARQRWGGGFGYSAEGREVRVSNGNGNGRSAWTDPKFILQLALLVGGLLGIYFTDRNSDTNQFATINAAAENLNKGIAEMKGKVDSIQGSVNTLISDSTGMKKDYESLRRDLDTMRNDNKLTDEAQQQWLNKINADIARLQAQVGR